MRAVQNSGMGVRTVWMDCALVGHIKSSCRSYMNFSSFRRLGRPESSLVGHFQAISYSFFVRRLRPSVPWGVVVLSDLDVEDATFHLHGTELIDSPVSKCPYKLCVVESVTDA